jgi:hypothetical protein
MSDPGLDTTSEGFCEGESTVSVLDSQRYRLLPPSSISKLSHLYLFVFLFWKMQIFIGIVSTAISHGTLRHRKLASKVVPKSLHEDHQLIPDLPEASFSTVSTKH